MGGWITRNSGRALAIGSIALWLLSLVLPAYYAELEFMPGIKGQPETTFGIDCFLLGWATPSFVSAVISAADPSYIPPGYHAPLPPTSVGAFLVGLAWYANPLWVWNLVRIFRGREVLVSVAIVSAALASASLEPVTIWHDDHGIDSASVPLVGVYVWVAAMSIPLVAAAATWMRRRAFT